MNDKLKKVLLFVILFGTMVANVIIMLVVFSNTRGRSGEDRAAEAGADVFLQEVTKSQTTEAGTEQPEIEPETEIKEIAAEYNDLQEEEPLEFIEIRTPVKVGRTYQEEFDLLRARYNNEDIVGILKIPGTVVFYPVVHCHDNYFYLHHDYFGRSSAAGSVFLDYENCVSRNDPNTILYAHNMGARSDVMFSHIRYFADEDFFNAHRYIIFNTVYENSVWETFSFFETHISFNYIQIDFITEHAFLNLAQEISSRSHYYTGIEINAGDRILILSTCTNRHPDMRYALASRLVRNRSDVPEHILELMDSTLSDYLG